MAQSTSGLHSFLSSPTLYTLTQTLLGGVAGRATVLQQYVRPRQGDRILDIGCGPGHVCGLLPPGVQYIGFDDSEAYVRSAQKHFGNRGTFYCDRVREETLSEHRDFDIVLAFGVLHHLDDPEAQGLFRLAQQALKPKGRLFALDACFVPTQSLAARWLLSLDRGKSIRTEQRYRALAEQVFPSVSTAIRHDLFWVPYTALVMECKSTGGPG